MQADPTSAPAAARATERMARAAFAVGLATAVLAGCGTTQTAPQPAPTLAAMSAAQAAATGVPVPPREALPFEEGVLSLANATLGWAQLPPPPAPGGRHPLVIDPLIDRATGAETAATRSMVAQIEALVRERYPQFELRPFTTATLDEQPLILLGAITPVAAPGSLTNASGPTETYRIWAVLADLRTGRILSHPTAWVRAATLDPTPTAFFRDSPVWAADESRAAYLRTCAGNPGDPIDPAYLRMLRAQALIADAVRAYEAGRFREALARYDEAAGLPGGGQLRALNGLYLANRALGRQEAAEASFARVVDYGLAQDRLGVKFLFRPGSTAFFWPDPGASSPYRMWLRQIARRSDARAACLQVTGHASPRARRR